MDIAAEFLNEKLREMISQRERSHRKEFAPALEQVMKSLSSVEKTARSLREAIGRAWGSITKSAEQHGVRLSEQVLEACKSLTTQSPDISYEELRKFEERSLQVVRSIAKTYNKYVRSIIRTVKPETSNLGDSIAALDLSIANLSQLLDGSDLEQLQILRRDADQLVESVGELRLKIDEIQKARDALRELEEHQSKLQSDLSLLHRDQNLKELGRIEQQIRQREAEALALLEPLSKPLRKLTRPESKAPAGLNKASLSELAENPLTAVLQMPVTEIRELLGSVQKLIERDELFLDQRRKRKSIESTQALRGGALERFREDHSVLQANRQEILRQLRGSGIYDQWLSLLKQCDDVRAEAAQCQNRIAELESQERRIRTLVLEDKARIESGLQKVLSEQVSILVPF